jgi:hypothetical protein
MTKKAIVVVVDAVAEMSEDSKRIIYPCGVNV